MGDENQWKHEGIEEWTWAYWLRDILKDTHIVHNYGTITNDNKTIARSLIYKVDDLLKSGVKAEDIIVIVQWTSVTRTSVFITPDKYNPANPYSQYLKTSDSWPHTNDYLINKKDKNSPYEHGYFHLSGGYNPVNNPINMDSFIKKWATEVMSFDERYFEWFEYINMLLNYLHINGITKIKFFNMSNNFSKEYLNGNSNPPHYSKSNYKSVYDCLVVDKEICNTWNDIKELKFQNSYVKFYADKIDFNKYFWFFEENSLHLFGGIIEWSIRNFDYNMEGNLPKVLWREMNGMSIHEQKQYLDKSWYGHTSSILAKKFVNDVVLNWDILK
jgi:hypothetical protein